MNTMPLLTLENQAGAQHWRAGSLGILTKLYSLSEPKNTVRRKKYELQGIASRLNIGGRVSWCGKRVNLASVQVKRGEHGAYYYGLMRCGDVWLCPFCARQVSMKRKEQLKKAAARGYTPILITYTIQHGRDDSLQVLLNRLNGAIAKMRTGKAGQDFRRRWELVANATALEITVSRANGFHPHKHSLYFSSIPRDLLDTEQLKREILAGWSKAVAKCGGYVNDYGVEVTIGEEASAGYIAKWGAIEEVSGSIMKNGKNGNLSMWELLELAGAGDRWALEKYKEYSQAVKGKRWFYWSRGASRILGIDDDDDDCENVQTVEDEIICSISRDDWALVLRHNRRAEVLDVADNGGAVGVAEYIKRLRLLERGDYVNDG